MHSAAEAILEVLSREPLGSLGGLLWLDEAARLVRLDARSLAVLGPAVPGTPLHELVGRSEPFDEAVLRSSTPALVHTPGERVLALAVAPSETGFLVGLVVPSLSDAALAATPAITLVLDAEARVLEASERARALFGGAQAVLGKQFADLVPAPVLQAVLERIVNGAPNPDLLAFEWQRPQGRRMFELTCGTTSPRGICVVTLVDVTETRKREAERERLIEAVHQAQKLDALGQLASGVAHDMSNVLAVVQTCAGALREELVEPLHRADAEQIVIATQRATDLLQQLKMYARKTPPRNEPFDIGEMIREVAAMVSRLLPGNIRLSLSLPTERRELTGDRSLLRQALVNICLNARDAMPNGGRLSLRAALDDRRCIVSVEDTGSGMTDDVKQRAFEPFFTTKRRDQGAGLGLSMAYTSARAHGGDIRLESTPGQGTQVTLWLPFDRSLPDFESVASLARPRGVAVVVDDDEGTRKVMARFLKKLGYSVHLAESGAEAVSLLRSGVHPRLVICDLVMPGIPGTETVSQLRALEPSVSVVVTTGFLEDESRPERLAGVSGLLRKPFSLKDLIEVVAKLPS